jgi:hypothetical protein
MESEKRIAKQEYGRSLGFIVCEDSLDSIHYRSFVHESDLLVDHLHRLCQVAYYLVDDNGDMFG